MKNTYIIYFDTLRVFAAFIVVLLHTSAYGYNKYDVGSMTWDVSLFWNILSKWGVPVFVMISGALFLQPSKEVSIKIVFSKYIKKIATLIISWSIIYSLYRLACGDINDLMEFVSSCIYGYYHLWFLYMIIGLYAITPLLKKMLENKTYIKYFIVLSLIFSFTIPTLYLIADSITLITGNEKIMQLFHILFERFHFSFTLEFVSYFLIGYYITSINITRKNQYIIYLLGLISFIFSFVYSLEISTKVGIPWKMNDNLSLNVLFESLLIFLLIRNLFNKQNKLSSIMNNLSKYTLGIYLIHAMILDILSNQEWFDILYKWNFFSIPLIAISVFVSSIFCITILGRISILKKIIY